MLALLATAGSSSTSTADESGVSFWLPGHYGSFAAVPYSHPGWAFEFTYHHAKASAAAGVGLPRDGALQVGVKSPSDFIMFTPTYVFETPVLGAQAAVGLTALFGRNATAVSATLTGPNGNTISGARADDVFGIGDLSPTVSLAWSRDVHNVTAYLTGNIPVGAYNINRLSALGLGYWAIDAGAGYTYYDEERGLEWSAVLGFTYNFINPHTQYRSGIGAHLDWAIAPYVTDKVLLGVAGYFYNQLTGDRGPGALLGDFKSRVAGIGPQLGFFFELGGREAYLNVKAFHEFNVRNRLAGWTAFVTLTLEPPERASSNGKNKISK
jgi:hypothetical protein